ncbi:MAG: excinuclease ABC subunit UvrC [Bacteroidales bacterium]|nr:excinuclease ABC subunit UvrC [Bacteroidales bacterium]
MSFSKELKNIVSVLPDKPGVYQYFDTDGKILYIGKAKNLKKRVSSYFSKNHNNAKTRILVRKIKDIKHIIVDTEQDALLLENNLIKKYQPRYNVLLKDDKSYPFICIKNERFPRIFSTRNIIKDGSTYYGPYTSSRMVKVLLELIKKTYKLRTCNLNLSEENIQNSKYKSCLEYQIGNCLAPCIGKQTEENYSDGIANIRRILKGNIHEVTNYLKELMANLAEEYKFEEANTIKDKIEILENFQSKSTIVNPSIHNIDVFSFVSDDKSAYVNFLKIINGAIIQSHTVELKKKLDETEHELLSFAIIDIRTRFESTSKEILVPFYPETKLKECQYTIPKIGDKKKLLDLSERNAKYFRLEKHKQMAKLAPQKRSNRILSTLQKDLHLTELPIHIEGFDNSNIQGTNPVAACVVFKNSKPCKKDYRKFNIKTVIGSDDFASMREIVFRRYSRLLKERLSLPQLIVIDGGKGQLSAAVYSLKKLHLYGKIAIIGIAKKLEEIYFPEDSIPLYLDKNSESLKLIQQIRDESHRFGITFHRNKRSKQFIKSELDEISGIGPKTVELLLQKFKTVANIKKTTLKNLEDLIGKSKAGIIIKYFSK